MAIININKITIIVSLLILIVINNQLKAQTIKIQTFGEQSQKISIALDTDRDVLIVATIKDTIHIGDCIVVENVHSLNKNFIEITYEIRGGSGIHVTRTLIFAALNNRLYQSLHITSLFKEEFIDYRKDPVSTTPDKSSLYETKCHLINAGYHNQKMIASIHSWQKLKDHPQKNFDREKKISLSFDTMKNVFYNSKVSLSQYFTIYDPKTQKERKQYLVGIFPTIQLGSYNYYYIKGDWYEKGHDATLSRYAYR